LETGSLSPSQPGWIVRKSRIIAPGGSKVESRRRTKPELAEEQPEKKQLAMETLSAKDHSAVTAPVLYFYFFEG
jgi:hypothetical protein